MSQTRTAFLELSEDGIIIVSINRNMKQHISDAEENLGAAVDLAKPHRRSILIDIQFCEPLEADVRHFYSGKILVNSFKALALVVDASPLGVMMGNIYFKVAKPGIPTQLFTDKRKAIHWLKGFT